MGPFMIAFSVLIMGYNGILISFLTIDVKPKLVETIEGNETKDEL